jgi:hypothetical protein
LSVFQNNKKLRLPAFCYYIAHAVYFSFIFFQPIISLKSPLLLLYELSTEILFFDGSRADPYSPLSSHQYFKFFFLFELLIFVVKLNTLTIDFIVHNVHTKILLISVYHRVQILNTSTGVSYNIRATYIFSADETINLCDLKRQIHTGLELLPNQFNINISARINTAPVGSDDFFIAYLGLFLMKFGDD